VEEELLTSRAGEQALTVQVLGLSNEVQDLRNRLHDTEFASAEEHNRTESELAELRSQVGELEVENVDLRRRSKTIESRYRAGDLTVEEKSFISELVKTTQSVHEQELVAKGNELRRVSESRFQY